MKTPIELPVLFHTKDTIDLSKIGVDYSDEDCEPRMVTFFNINAVTPYRDENDNFTDRSLVYCNGDTFQVLMHYNELLKRLV